MNWLVLKKISVEQIGTFLALMLIIMAPHFSPRLPSVVLGLLGAWLVWTQRTSLFDRLAARRLAGVFALLWVPILLSIPDSLDWRYSAQVATAVLLYSLVGLALINVLRGDDQRLWLAKWLMIAMLVWMADGFFQYLVGRNVLGFPLTSDGRLTGVFRGNMSLSATLAIMSPIAVWYFMRKRPLVVLAILFGAGIVAVLVGTRNALVMVMVVVAGTSLCLPRRYRMALVAVMLLVAGAVSLSPAMKERFQRSAEVGTATFENYNSILSGRLTIWETAGRMIIDRPLTGIGAGMFPATYDQYSTRADDPFRTGGTIGGPTYAHNIYVSVAAETGMFGLLGIIVAFVLCMKWYYEASPLRREQAWPYAFGLLIAVFPISIENVLFKHTIFPVVLLLLCAALAALDDKPTGAKIPVRR